ncbi:nonstructural protein [Apis mellifera associated microvirus 24]|nr:nonstructural protein [Apis mellifera associated microvirus 24]AZL82788.1 nonstructural protein [Apis mellifera associated microvirus 24]AZL82853.1 nonstructural protein [Apis mellifera associated microvirus 24]
MNYKLFSVRDAKSEIFHPPWFKLTHGEAERDFRSAVNDEKTNLNKYPEDYDLYYVGEYDDNSGRFSPLDTPQHVIKAVQCFRAPSPT